MNMPNLARSIGILLILIGTIAYLASDRSSVTALIPAFIGIPIFILGYAGRKENLRHHMMHGATAIAVLGLVGAIVTLITRGTAASPLALLTLVLMALLCLVFLVFAVRSFITARTKAGTQ